MFTIKIYADGSTFIRSCNSVHIIQQQDLTSDNPSTYDEECASLKEDYANSSILDDLVAQEGGLSLEAMQEHKLQEMMPYAFIHYDWNGEECKWLLHGHDKAYIISEQGKTIEAITRPKWLVSQFNVEAEVDDMMSLSGK